MLSLRPLAPAPLRLGRLVCASMAAFIVSLTCPPALAQSTLPPEVQAALTRARLPREALSVMVVDAQGTAPPRISYRADQPVNPASVMKLVTTFAALDQLGPAFTWNTPVYTEGTLRDGTLNGNLYIQGQGDPKLVMERLWLLMRRVQGLGIRHITGDIVLDHSAFQVAPQDPGEFDGEPLRPYNASADALLLNFKSVVMTFSPDRAQGLAHIAFDPPLAGVQMQSSVPLAPAAAECGDYRSALKADVTSPGRIQFAGSYAAACAERAWPMAYIDPASYASRAVAGMWREVGGTLGGHVRDGQVPAGLTPAFQFSSVSLAETIRDINKYSNNVMAQQVFLTLSLQQKGLGSSEGSRELLRRWWRERISTTDVPVVDSGSGLSRDSRITARGLARMLQVAWSSPLMPELASSLPIVGVDGTLKRVQGQAVGAAHLKTGSLRDVSGMAGYVHAANGKRYVLVAIANHPNAAAARPVIEALIDWTARDR